MHGSVVDCIEVNIDFFGEHFHQWNGFDRLYRCNYWIFFLKVVILLKCLLQKKRKVNAILRKESRNMRQSIGCKTLIVSVWDVVMKLTAVNKYYFSSDIRNFKNIKSPPPPIFFIAYNF